jgi:hypothetical protein
MRCATNGEDLPLGNFCRRGRGEIGAHIAQFARAQGPTEKQWSDLEEGGIDSKEDPVNSLGKRGVLSVEFESADTGTRCSLGERAHSPECRLAIALGAG